MKFLFSEVVNFLDEKAIVYTIQGIHCDLNVEFCLASIKNKINNGLYFLTSEYLGAAKDVESSLIFTDASEYPKDTNTYIKVTNPQLVHYKLSSSQELNYKPGIHPTSIVSPEADIHPSVYIGPFCFVGKVKIDENVQLLHHVTLSDNVQIMKNTIIEGHSAIGARGMAWIWDEYGERVVQPQLGGVVIGENCLLGTDITIVRGSLNEFTTIGNDTIIAHGTKIGHGSTIGSKVHFANNVSLAGNATIKDRVFLGSASVVSSNIIIEEGCIVGAGAVVNKNFKEKNCTLVGVPAVVLKTNNYDAKPNGAPKPYKN